jgi:hypothetical protein
MMPLEANQTLWEQSGKGKEPNMWHVVFAEPGQLPKSLAARSRDSAIGVACELLAEGRDVRRVLEPNGRSIERSELDEHYDEGRFPALRTRCLTRSVLSAHR